MNDVVQSSPVSNRTHSDNVEKSSQVRFPTGPGTYDALQKSLVAAPDIMLQLTDNQKISVRFFIMVNITKMSIYYESHSVCSVPQDDLTYIQGLD
jgi:hypothetical protein